MKPFKILILGAECTGKSTLASALHSQLNQYGKAHLCPEYLRLFVHQHKRLPSAKEQLNIAKSQKDFEQQANNHRWVICDTGPLLTAIYSEQVFGECPQELNNFSIDSFDYDLVLLTEIDFPWIADGIQRDGPEAQQETHRRLIKKLNELQIPHHKITGNVEERLTQVRKILGSSLT